MTAAEVIAKANLLQGDPIRAGRSNQIDPTAEPTRESVTADMAKLARCSRSTAGDALRLLERILADCRIPIHRSREITGQEQASVEFDVLYRALTATRTSLPGSIRKLLLGAGEHIVYYTKPETGAPTIHLAQLSGHG